MSEGIHDTANPKAILLSRFPLARNVERAAISDDKSGTDYWVTMPSGHKQSVDVKVREIDWRQTHPKEDDIALETWSVVEQEKIGWTRDTSKRTDYILWIWKDTGRWLLIPFPMLCSVFVKNMEVWSKKYGTKKQQTHFNGSYYHSECVFVPRLLIWREIYNTYGGHV